MAEPKVSVLLTMVDKLSQPLEGVRGSLAKSGASFKALGKEAMDLLNNKLIQGVGFYGMVRGLQGAWEAADRLRVAQQKLDGTAKITGVSLDFLEGIANDAAASFGLSKTQAADFAVEMAKLASKAGDVGAAAPALQAFLDIGAARGLTASETLKAVQQAILGIDEGTDKLFNANPSVLYAMFAESIGTTAGKLTDQEKAQALLNAAMEDGSKVTGAYSAWLETVAGKAQLAANRAEEAQAKLGDATEQLRIGLAEAKVFGADLLTGVVQSVQLAGEYVGYLFMRFPLEIQLLWEAMLVGVASGIEKLGSIIPFVGDKIEEAGRTMLAKHKETGQAIMAQLSQYEQFHAESQAEILGIDITGAQARYDAAKLGERKITNVKGEANKERQQQEKDAQKALEELRKDEAEATLEAMTAYGRAMHDLQDKLNRAMLSSDQETRDEAVRLWHAGLARIHAEYVEIAPRIRETTTQIRGFILDLPPAIDAGGEAAEDSVVKWERLKAEIGETGAAIGKGAEEILRFGRDIGATNPELEQLIGGIGRLAEGIGGIASGNLIGGLASGILGLQGIVGSLFGNGPEEQARRNLLRQNSERLRQLKDSIGDLMASQSSGATIAKAQGLDFGFLTAGGDNGVGRMQRLGALGSFLNSQGLTMSDFESILKDLGIDWGNWKTDGVSSAMIQQLMTGLANFEPGQFDQSFGGQQDFLQRYFNVAGIDSPALQAEFARNNLVGKNDFLANLIGGFDLNTAGGRAGLQEAFAQIFQQLNNGTFDVAQFGQLTGSEFVDFIEYFTGLLDQMGGGAASGGSATFDAPSTGLPVSVTAEAATTLLEPLTAIVEYTRRTAEALEAGNLGSITIGSLNTRVAGESNPMTDRFNEDLQVLRDLYAASTGGS